MSSQRNMVSPATIVASGHSAGNVNHSSRGRVPAARINTPVRKQTDFVSLHFDCPPSANNAFVNVPGKGRRKSRAYAEWRTRAAWQVEAKRPGRIVGPYQIKIAIRRASLRADLDGFLKPILDLLVACGVTDDDCRCQHIEMTWSDVYDGAHVSVSAVQRAAA